MTAETLDRPMQRLRQLIEELRDEEGGDEYGWKSAVATRLQMDQGYFSKVLSGERVSVGRKVIEKAIVSLKLRSDYFYGEAKPRSYRDYVGSRYPAFDEFCRGEHGRSMTPGERKLLASVDWQGETPDIASYNALLVAIRGTASGRVHEVEAFNRAVDQQMQAQAHAQAKKAARQG